MLLDKFRETCNAFEPVILADAETAELVVIVDCVIVVDVPALLLNLLDTFGEVV
jgi:hypothetical protein